MISVKDWLNCSHSLLADLDDAKLPTGLGEQLKVLRLLQLLEERGAAPDTPESLALWVAPVLCSRSDQVEPLRRVLTRHFAPHRRRVPEREALGAAPMPREARVTRRFSLARPAALLAVVVVLGAAAYLLLQTRLPQIAIPGATNISLGRPSDTAPGTNLVELSIAIVFLLAVIAFLIWRRIRLAVRHGRVAGEGQAQEVRVEPPKEDKDNPELLRTARVLNRPHRRHTGRLDVAATVRATAAAGGRFSPAELIRRVPANWMLLVERAGAEDPLPEFGARLSKLLGRSGVRHGLYEFRRSPEWVRRKEPRVEAHRRNMPLERALAADRPTRVLMLAEASRAVDVRNKGPARWLSENDVPAPVALLTPNPRENWSGAEALAAQSGVLVLSADSVGLASLAQRIEAAELEPSTVLPRPPTEFDRWQEERFTWLSQTLPAGAVRANLIATLQALLRKDEFRLLVGIAAFPQVRLNLMATLDHKLHPGDIPSTQRARLLTLGRLVWVKEGVIPDWLREDLMRALPPPELREVRERWMELLSDAPQPGEAASALTIHLAEGGDQADAAQGDGLFLGFLRGHYDLPAPLRFVRLAGLWRTPDQTELVAAAAGLFAAALAFLTDVDVAALAERCLRAWYDYVEGVQRFVPWTQPVSFGLTVILFAVALNWQTPLNAPLINLAARVAFFPTVVVLTSTTVAFGWLGIPVRSFDFAQAFNHFMAPLIIGAGGGALIIRQQRPVQRSAVDALSVAQQSRGTGLTDTATMLVLLWLFIAGSLGRAILMPTLNSILLANELLIAVAGLGLARACLISWSAARLQHPFAPPPGIMRNIVLVMVFGQIVGAAFGWMTMAGMNVRNALPDLNYSFGMWQISHGLMLSGALVALSVALDPHGRPFSSSAINWCAWSPLVAYGAQGLAQMLLTDAGTQADAAFLIAMLPAGMVALLSSTLAFRPLAPRGPFAVAVIALGGICAAVGVVPLYAGPLLMRSSWLPAVPLVAATIAAWPLVQRALTDEPSIAREPPGWRARPVEPVLWIAAPLLLLTAIQIPLGRLTLDLPVLVIPLAIWLGWGFGLRGWRTALLMVLPAVWSGLMWLTSEWLSQPDANLLRWISAPTLDVAATALLAAALFARPGLFAQVRATARVPGWAVGALALALSIQVGGGPAFDRGGITQRYEDLQHIRREFNEGLQTKEAVVQAEMALRQTDLAAHRGWAPATLPVLALFLLATTRLRKQAAVLFGSVAFAGLASSGLNLLGLRTIAVLPLSSSAAVVGLIGYAVGRYHERISAERNAPTAGTPFKALDYFVGAGLLVAVGASVLDTSDAYLALAMLLAWTLGVRVGGSVKQFRVGAILLALIGLSRVVTAIIVPEFGWTSTFAPFLPLVLFVIGTRCSGAVTQSAPATSFPIDSVTVLAVALFLYFLIVLQTPIVPDQPSGWFFTATKTTIARLASIGLTVWLMQNYSVFRRLPGGPPSYFGYVLCGVIAAAASAGVCLIFRLGDVNSLSGLIVDLPVIVLSGVLCAALSLCCDDWSGDTVAPTRLRFVEAVGCGLVMAVVMALPYFGTDLLPKGMSPWVLGLPPMLGLLVGGWVPHIYRSSYFAAKRLQQRPKSLDLSSTSRTPAVSEIDGTVIETDIPARLDRLPWSKFHWLVVLALGITWILDGLEVTLAGTLVGAIKKSLQLTAANVELANSAYLVGAACGALYFGRLTDRLGRKKLFFVTLIVYMTFTAATACSWNIGSLALFRFLTGAGIGGEYAAINSAIQELIPARYRGRTDLAINGTFWVGAALGAVGSLVVLDETLISSQWGWRLAFSFGAGVACFIYYLRRWIPESPRWLMTHHRVEEGAAIVEFIEEGIRKSGHEIAPVSEPLSRLRGRRYTPLREVAWTLLYFYPRRTLVGFSLMAAQAFFYNAIFFTYPLVLIDFFKISSDQIGWYILPFAVGNFCGPLMLGWLFDILGRRLMIAFTYALSGALLAASGALFVVDAITAAQQTAAWMVVFFFASAAASSAYLTVSEIFPLEIRALAIAVFFAIGTGIGGAFTPWLFGWLIDTGSRMSVFLGYLLGSTLMIGAAIVEWLFGIDAERKGLESVARPLTFTD